MPEAERVHSTQQTNTSPIEAFHPTRRALLAGLAIAAIPTAIAAGTVTTLAAANTDPIFAAIEAHLQATQALDRLIAVGPYDRGTQDAAIANEHLAGDVLISTAPTTLAGLRALERHLRQERSAPAVFMSLGRPWMIATGRCIHTNHHVDMLIAKRAFSLVVWRKTLQSPP
jgi:hypothetical protein